MTIEECTVGFIGERNDSKEGALIVTDAQGSLLILFFLGCRVMRHSTGVKRREKATNAKSMSIP